MMELSPSKQGLKRSYRLEVWALVMVPVIETIRHNWKSAFHGSKLFVIQRKLQLIHSNLRSWCLEYKKTRGIHWEYFERGLGESQGGIR